MRSMDRRCNVRLKIDLHTNGLLLKKSCGLICGSRARLTSCSYPSTPPASRPIRSSARVESCFHGLSALGRQNCPPETGLCGSVAEFPRNARFFEIARQSGADSVKFQMIRTWGTNSVDNFAHHNSGNSGHSAHADFVRVLAATPFEKTFS